VLVSGPTDGDLILNADGSFTYTPAPNWNGTDSFVYKANDGLVDSNNATVEITVNVINDPPVLTSIGNKSVDEETLLSFTTTASDHDIPVQTLTFSLVGEPEGASIDPGTGAFTWTPSEAQGLDTYTFNVCISDGALDDCETIEVTVNEVNVAPVLDPIGDKSVDEETLLSFTATCQRP
jgi:hypothetical protein